MALTGALIWWGASPTQAAEMQPSNTVAVLDFTLENSAANVRDRLAGLADFFEVALQKQDVPVLERRNIRLILAERDLQASDSLSVETLSQAKLPAVDYFISGNVAFQGVSEFTLTLSIVRADKNTVESTLTQHGSYPDDWLPAMNALATEVSSRLQIQKSEISNRSEFEMMTWLPEAALPFFEGLDYYSRGDYARAVPWFQASYGKDQHFDLARRWEARAYRKLNLPLLADAMSGPGINNTNLTVDSQRPVAAIVASGNISAAARAAFVEVVAQTGRLQLFEPASIGATAREIDLQLTGQMAASLNERSVWLVVDDLIYLDTPDAQTLVVRQQNLLSGEVVRQVRLRTSDIGEAGCAMLAKAFLDSKSDSAAQNTNAVITDRGDLPEPVREDPPDVAFAKALRLAAANPQSARLWIGLADFYSGETRKLLLERAVSAVATNRQARDASFWLASALWREREMTRRIFYIPTATRLASNPLTNDFARLLQWYPDSYEAKNLVEVTIHGEGSYVDTEIKDGRYLDSVFNHGSGRPPPPVPKPATTHAVGPVAPVAPVVTDEERVAMLNKYLQNGNNARAWLVVNSLVNICDSLYRPQTNPAKQQAELAKQKLLATAAREAQIYATFLADCNPLQAQAARETGEKLLNCVFRRLRLEVIFRLGQIIKENQGLDASINFTMAQMEKFKDDFEFDPVTRQPAEQAQDFYFMLEFNLPNWPHLDPPQCDPNLQYAVFMEELAAQTQDNARPDLSEKIFQGIWQNEALPLKNRLTAECDLAEAEFLQGRSFEALEKLKDVLQQTQGTGLPVARGNLWSSEQVEGLAFGLLRKVRIYAEAGGDICDCCGKVPDEPPQKPANFEEINHRLAQLWKQQIGEAGTNLPPIEQQLLADKDNFFPTILYKLRTGQEVSHTLVFCSDLGTNALPALPVIVQIIQRGEPFQDYNNALYALGALGPAAGCAKPLLILARENADNGNFNYAFERIGPAPRRVLPELAQLLYHKNPAICKEAADAMIETAALDRRPFKDASSEQQVVMIRKWWEDEGGKIDWKDWPKLKPTLN